MTLYPAQVVPLPPVCAAARLLFVVEAGKESGRLPVPLEFGVSDLRPVRPDTAGHSRLRETHATPRPCDSLVLHAYETVRVSAISAVAGFVSLTLLYSYQFSFPLKFCGARRDSWPRVVAEIT